MGYIDLIPDIFRLTMPSLATAKSYHTQKFNVGNKCCIGVTIKASQALSVAVAYGIVGDTAAAAGVDVSGTLPYKTSATTFASSTGTEGGTYHEIAIPPHARQAQLVISNASGSTVSGAVIDAALRVVAYPASGSGGSSDFGDITGWPGTSSQFIKGDGSVASLGATDISAALDAGSGTADQVVRGDGTISALGAADIQPLDPLQTPVTTGGTSTAYTLTDTRIGTPVDGQVFSFIVHTNCGASPTLAVNGGAARALAKFVASGVLVLEANQAEARSTVVVRYNSASSWYVVISSMPLTNGDIPVSLGITTFNGITVGSSSPLRIETTSTSNTMTVRAGNAANGAGITSSGSTNASPGQVTLHCLMLLKAASTAYNMWPITTNWHGSIWLIDDVMTGNAVTEVVIKAGVIAAINGDTTCYKTGAAIGDQMQLTISGGFLVGTTGNTYARYLGINANRMGYK